MVSCVQEGSALIIARFSECLLAKLLALTCNALMSLSLTVLKRLQFHRTVLSFIMAGCFFCYVFNGNCNHLHQKDAFHFLSRAWNYNKYNMSPLGDIFYFASSDVRKLDLRLTEGKKA